MNDGPANDGKVPKKERMRFVSVEQVAQLAGVSRSAVSRTFTPGASVAPATREKVLRAAQELGYHVSARRACQPEPSRRHRRHAAGAGLSRASRRSTGQKPDQT